MSLQQQVAAYRKAFAKRKLIKPSHCQICARAGTIQWHAVYWRTLITFQEILTIPVRRVSCTACHHTFALLPPFVAKFHRYARPLIRSAVHRLEHLSYNAVADWFMERCQRSIATLTLYLWRRRFVRSPA